MDWSPYGIPGGQTRPPGLEEDPEDKDDMAQPSEMYVYAH